MVGFVEVLINLQPFMLSGNC